MDSYNNRSLSASTTSPATPLFIDIPGVWSDEKNRERYDDVDLLSECSTPALYVPGKFLQLCDISGYDELTTDDRASFFPSSGGRHGDVSDTQPTLYHKHLSSQADNIRFHSHMTSWMHNPRVLFLVTVCLVVAILGLGGLATVL